MTYFNILIGSLNVLVISFLLQRLRGELMPRLSQFWLVVLTLFFAFGTTHFYLATLSGVWHTAQIVAFLPTSLGLLAILKKERRPKDYFWSILLISLAFWSRFSMVGLLVIPLGLWFWDWREKEIALRSLLTLLLIPVFFGLCLGLYNLIRFDSFFETGYRYVIYHPHFREAIDAHGLFSLKNIPQNLRFMLFEIPEISLREGLSINLNLNGNSFLFLAPPLLTALLAFPWKNKPYHSVLWLSVFMVMAPLLLVYTTGWIQFGYRFSLDFMTPLLVLSVFGVRGRPNAFYFGGVIFAIWMQFQGISILR